MLLTNYEKFTVDLSLAKAYANEGQFVQAKKHLGLARELLDGMELCAEVYEETHKAYWEVCLSIPERLC